MVSEELISLIVPVYKVENYLDRCLESLVNQTYRDLEILLVDDGSPDSSGEIAEVWQKKDSRIRVFHKENGGQSSARNLGLRQARGKYIGFVDADDFVEPQFAQTLYSLLVKNNAGISAIGYQEVSDTILPEHDAFEPSDTEILDTHDAIRELFCPDKYCDYLWNKLYRKELFSGIGFPDGQVYEDTGVLYRLIDRCEKMVWNPARLYCYYQRGNSTIRREDIRAMHDRYAMLRQRYLYVKGKYPDIEMNYRQFFSESLLLSQYLDKDEQRRNREELKELWPRVKNTVSVKDKLKYFFCIHMSRFYYGLCKAKKRIIG